MATSTPAAEPAKEQPVSPAAKQQAGPGPSMLVRELQATHPKIADKVAKLEALHAEFAQRDPDKRQLSRDEAKEQAKHTPDDRDWGKVQEVEYGTFVADEDIHDPHGGSALWYAQGAAVPVSVVERFGWDTDDPPRVSRVRGNESRG